jgi:hypothetical protein
MKSNFYFSTQNLTLMKYFIFLFGIYLMACTNPAEHGSEAQEGIEDTTAQREESDADLIQNQLEKYTEVTLTTDTTVLTPSHKKMLPHLIKAAKIMDELFWVEAYGKKDSLLNTINNSALAEFVRINYGPWDRLAGNEPFVEGVGAKPKGANFYPKDMTQEEFEQSALQDKKSLYTMIRRDSSGRLTSIPYHEFFKEEVNQAADHLLEAAKYTDNAALKNYLQKRAKALRTDEYYESDLAWMDMKDNQLDIIIGPIETYEDQLFGYKAAHEAYILVKDLEWSKKLEKYAAMLPELQKNLPVDKVYKAEKPGTESQLAAFDVIYYAGDCNAGSKTIAVNLPNDEEVQLKKGTRRSQLKNAMRAKFDKILVPIADELIVPEQRKHITFDAFFANTMFHEVAHGLGIKNTINNMGTVRQALKDNASALEEGKADILGLYMITELHKKGEIQGDIKDYFTTFMASVFRSVRFGASSAHGKANMIRFNYFREQGAISKNEKGYYVINYDKMTEAMNSLSGMILKLQGDGDYEGVARLVEEKALIMPELQSDLDRLSEAGIPVDVVFRQGLEVLGLDQ